MKTHPITCLDKPRTLSYGAREMRECSRICGKDPLRNGEHWIQGVSTDNIIQLAVVLLQREDPTITAATIESAMDANPDQVLNELGMAIVKLLGFSVDADPQTPTATSTPTSGGPSADSTSA